MKYVILVPDGAGDRPSPEHGGMTPLEAARIPNMDFLAQEGICGTAVTIPEGMTAGSDVANYSIMGYDPRKYYSGRGPLEAASMGISLRKEEVAFRCNLVSVDGDRLLDYSAGHISSEEAGVLISFLQDRLGDEYTAFHTGVGYRHLLVLLGEKFLGTHCVPPHDVVGREIVEVAPVGDGAERLRALMRVSRRLLEEHEVNRRRVKRGERPANMIWPWGQGKPPALPTLRERYGLDGVVITAVDLIKGLGLYAGLRVVDVPGATGYHDTDYRAKAAFALHNLHHMDLAYVHVEAPDEAGHEGNWEAKVRALENFDRHVVGAFLDEAILTNQNFSYLLLPDHLTPLEVRTHVPDPVPFAIYYAGLKPDGGRSFSEQGVREGSHREVPAWNLLEMILGGTAGR